jgi:cyanophycinase
MAQVGVAFGPGRVPGPLRFGDTIAAMALSISEHGAARWAPFARSIGLPVALALLLGSASGDVRAPQAVGTTVVIGGALRDDNAAVWSRLVALAGGPGSRWAVLATASGEPVESAAAIAANLRRHGARTDIIAVAPLWPGIDALAAARDPAWAARVRACQGVYFGGGAQTRLVDTLQPGGRSTPVLDAVRSVYERGGVVAGTSSGAAVMSRTIFLDAPDVLAAMKGRLREGIEVGQGFGLLPAGLVQDLVVDQHFLKRGRIGRLLPLLARRRLPLGLGVEEDSAAIVRQEGVEAVGARGVVLVDLRDAATGSQAPAEAFGLRGVRLSYLASGDRYAWATRSLHPAKPDAARLAPAAPHSSGRARFHADMLSEGVLYSAMVRLLEDADEEAFGLSFTALSAPDDPAPDLAFEWRLYQASDTMGWQPDPTGASDLSIANVRLDVRAVRLARPLTTPWKP